LDEFLSALCWVLSYRVVSLFIPLLQVRYFCRLFTMQSNYLVQLLRRRKNIIGLTTMNLNVNVMLHFYFTKVFHYFIQSFFPGIDLMIFLSYFCQQYKSKIYKFWQKNLTFELCDLNKRTEPIEPNRTVRKL
jgi:hypothetical protein